MKYGALAALVVIFAYATPCAAAPSEVIILRHGEKADSYRLCGVGVARAQALAQTYLGQGATSPLLPNGQAPAEFLAITLHTLELITPAAASWNVPVVDYSVVPPKQSDDALNRATQVAAHDVLTQPRYDGKVVVMAWEHKHIANAQLAASASEPVTLRQLFHLDRFGSRVPETWNGNNYDYFWIVSFDSHTGMPTAFKAVKQVYSPQLGIPSNDWTQPEGLPANTDCLQKS